MTKSVKGRQTMVADRPYNLAVACLSIQPHFTAKQVEVVTGFDGSYVSKTLSYFMHKGLLSKIGVIKRLDQFQGEAALYEATPKLEKTFNQAHKSRTGRQSAKKQIEMFKPQAKPAPAPPSEPTDIIVKSILEALIHVLQEKLPK